MKFRKRMNQTIAVTLVAVNLILTPAVLALAGPPEVTTDEALYVNLDFYGKEINSSVVKGCNLNGIRSFKDYGKYKDVTNMSNYAEPVVEEDGISWVLPEDVKERFYYECQLETGSIIMPWDFDVSYKLNGVPVDASKLLHADGLVEIDVNCEPNNNAKEYYRNNMILQVATMVDMEDVRNIDAPGAQVQSIGTYKVVIFAGVPGEESDFHLEISSSDFEFPGLIIMMIPGTLDQMKEIKEIKELRDTFYDSTDEIIDGMNELLDRLDGMTSGMESARAGLADLQKARANFDASKDRIASDSDASLNELDSLSITVSAMTPEIEQAKDTLTQINDDMNRMVETLRGSSSHFFELSSKISDLEDDIQDMANDRSIFYSVEDIESQIDVIDSIIADMEAGLNTIKSLKDKGADSSMIDAALGMMQSQANDLLDELGDVVGDQQIKDIRKQIEAMDSSNFETNYAELARMTKQYQEVIKKAKKVLAKVRQTARKASDSLDTGQDAARELSEVLADMDALIGDINELNHTVNVNKDSFDELLDRSQEMTDSLGNSISYVTGFFRTVQDTLRNNRRNLEQGTKNTLDGLIGIMEKAVEISPTTGKLQDANESLRESLKTEIDKIAGDTNLLDLDIEQNKISFTSDQNPEPGSIQIIVRTEEISEDSININAIDIEPEKEDIGVWQRIVEVFRRLWKSLTSLFE